MTKKRKMPLKNSVQGFQLCTVLILVRHDQKIKKTEKSFTYAFQRVSRGSTLLKHLLRFPN